MIVKALIRGKVHGNITRGLYKSGHPKLAKTSSAIWKITKALRILT